MKTAIIRAGFDTIYFSGAHLWLRPFLAGIGSIVMLHHVRPATDGGFRPNRSLEVTPEFLTDTVRWLRRAGLDIVSLDEMHRRLTECDFTRRFVCITLDDGYRDNKLWAYPILKALDAPFAIYIPTSFPDRRAKLWWLALEAVIAKSDSIVMPMDGQERRFDCATVVQKRQTFNAVYWGLRSLPSEDDIHASIGDLVARCQVDMARVADELCMDWDEIGALAKDPLVTIGAHTVNHVMLGKATDEVARAELKASREVIEARIGSEVRHFAYPYGGADLVGTREFRIAAELGYKTAVTTRPGVLFPEHREHLTALPRLSLNGEYQRARYMKVLMSGAGTGVFNGFRRVNAA
jgi:peptidoglycan/xylan/chitin deacetylase (PgdA/CDA1 family)